jgi:hypothetical protein
MNLLYSLTDTKKVSSSTNKNGGVYVSDTMDVYVLMEDGEKIFASDSAKNIRTNIYRLGYYYYDVHFLENDFKGNVNEGDSSLKIDSELFSHKSTGIGQMKVSKDGEITVRIVGGDPYIVTTSGDNQFTFSADDYNAIRFSIKSTNANAVQVYYMNDGDKGHTDGQKASVNIEPDGEYHTYYVNLSSLPGFEGNIYSMRLDPNGGVISDQYDISEISFEKRNTGDVYLARAIHVYSDKVHQTLQFASKKEVNNIAELGIIYEKDCDIVENEIQSFTFNGIKQFGKATLIKENNYFDFSSISNYIIQFDNINKTINIS